MVKISVVSFLKILREPGTKVVKEDFNQSRPKETLLHVPGVSLPIENEKSGNAHSNI